MNSKRILKLPLSICYVPGILTMMTMADIAEHTLYAKYVICILSFKLWPILLSLHYRRRD